MNQTVERLTILRNFMAQQVPQDKLDMNVWSEDDDDCGSAACAMGWACRIPEFNDLGLLIKHGTPRYLEGRNPARPHVSYEAGEHFFGLTMREVEYLFDPNSYAQPECWVDPNDEESSVRMDVVIDRIDEIIRDRMEGSADHE